MIPFVRSSPAAEIFGRDRPAPEVGTDRPNHSSEETPESQSRRGVRRTAIIGAGSIGRTLAQSLEATGGYQLIGFIEDDPREVLADDEMPILGGRDDAMEIVRRYDIDELFIAYAPTWQQKLVDDLAAFHPTVDLRVVPSMYEAMLRLGDIENLGDLAVVRLASRDDRDLAKRIFDLTVALTGLIVLAPILAAVAALIKVVSPGPAIFKQERVGKDGRPFTLYKFRTMKHDAEAGTGPVLANGPNDPRLTGIGRWIRLCRIDELPQLWNVVRGEMSMVGPRPERPYFVRKFERMIPSYARRHQVRPGMTGLAQICGGYHTDARDKLRFDLIYASHRSLWMDLSILFRTIAVCFLPFLKRGGISS